MNSGLVTFVPAEAAKRKSRQKSKNRKTRCIFVTFKLKQISNINAIGVSMTFDSYKEDGQTPSFSQRYVKKSEQELPSKSQSYRNAFDVFKLFYPKLTPNKDPEAFTKLAILLNSFWEEVKVVADESKGAYIQEYNLIIAESEQVAVNFIEELVLKLEKLKGLAKISENEYKAKLCWNKREMSVKF